MRFENNAVWFLEGKDSCKVSPLEMIKEKLIQSIKSSKGFEWNNVCL